MCPGVCVAERISNHCEAALDVDGLCKPYLRCCVPYNLFEGKEVVPKEFVVIMGQKDKRKQPATNEPNVSIKWTCLFNECN